jgi:lysozyme
VIASARVYSHIREMEGLRLVADARDGTWTCGYGHTQGVTPGMRCTPAQAETWLLDDVELRERCVRAIVKVALTQGQFDALVDWVYNLGVGRLIHSPALDLINAHAFGTAWAHLRQYVHDAKGVVEPGLVRRRAIEEGWWHEAG